MPMPAASSDRKLPVTVITGYLGSGKTTLLNYLLNAQHGRRIAVIVNEFGEVGIDSQLLVTDHSEQLIEFNNGCLCCTVRGDLISTIGALRERAETLDAILIETTGLADPAPVAATFFVADEIRASTRLDAFITVVDAVNVTRNLEQSVEAQEQVAFADILLLNKCDLVDEARLLAVEHQLRTLNPLARLHRSVNAQVDLGLLLDTHAFELGAKLQVEPQLLKDHAHEHDPSISSFVLRESRPLDINRFMAWVGPLLQHQGDQLLRTKGVLFAKGFEQRLVFQSVRMLNSLGRLAPWPAEMPRHSEYVMIGRDLDRAALEAGFAQCVHG